jgi:hypothetical protein
MWCCLGICLTLFAFGLARYTSAPQLQGVTGGLREELPRARCPAQTLEADGVCVPMPAPSNDPSSDPEMPPMRGGLAPALVKQLQANEGWLAPLTEAPIPAQFRVQGQALTFSFAINTPFVCPSLKLGVPRIEAVGTDWLLLRSTGTTRSASHEERDILLLLAGIKLSAATKTFGTSAAVPQSLVGTPCTPGLPLGVTREFVTLSARSVNNEGSALEQFRLGETLDARNLLNEAPTP